MMQMIGNLFLLASRQRSRAKEVAHACKSVSQTGGGGVCAAHSLRCMSIVYLRAVQSDCCAMSVRLNVS